jgi:hypothetical protein
MRKIWLRFSDPWCHPWVVSPGMSLFLSILLLFLLQSQKDSKFFAEVVLPKNLCFETDRNLEAIMLSSIMGQKTFWLER